MSDDAEDELRARLRGYSTRVLSGGNPDSTRGVSAGYSDQALRTALEDIVAPVLAGYLRESRDQVAHLGRRISLLDIKLRDPKLARLQARVRQLEKSVGDLSMMVLRK